MQGCAHNEWGSRGSDLKGESKIYHKVLDPVSGTSPLLFPSFCRASAGLAIAQVQTLTLTMGEQKQLGPQRETGKTGRAGPGHRMNQAAGNMTADGKEENTSCPVSAPRKSVRVNFESNLNLFPHSV